MTDLPEDYWIDFPEATVEDFILGLDEWLADRGLNRTKSQDAELAVYYADGTAEVFTVPMRDLEIVLAGLPGDLVIQVGMPTWGPQGADIDASGAFDAEPVFFGFEPADRDGESPPDDFEAQEGPAPEPPEVFEPAPEPPEPARPREREPEVAPPREVERPAPAPPREVTPSVAPGPRPEPAREAPATVAAQVFGRVDTTIRTVADRIETAGRTVFGAVARLFGRRG